MQYCSQDNTAVAKVRFLTINLWPGTSLPGYTFGAFSCSQGSTTNIVILYLLRSMDTKALKLSFIKLALTKKARSEGRAFILNNNK
jgi:hypothetical protein